MKKWQRPLLSDLSISQTTLCGNPRFFYGTITLECKNQGCSSPTRVTVSASDVSNGFPKCKGCDGWLSIVDCCSTEANCGS